MKPDYLDQLIEKASTAAGNDSKLAKSLGVGRSAVSDWRKGSKPCPVADVVLMAQLAGLEPEKWAARALISQYEGTAKGDKLYRALGKLCVATGAAIATFGANAHQIFSYSATSFCNAGQQTLEHLIRCILC
jgi:DNA-binding transcriptional regulator YdaS (Cro superfamily)